MPDPKELERLARKAWPDSVDVDVDLGQERAEVVGRNEHHEAAGYALVATSGGRSGELATMVMRRLADEPSPEYERGLREGREGSELASSASHMAGYERAIRDVVAWLRSVSNGTYGNRSSEASENTRTDRRGLAKAIEGGAAKGASEAR